MSASLDTSGKTDGARREQPSASHHTEERIDSTSIEDTKPGKFIWFVALIVGINGFLLGYNTGIISAIQLYLFDDLGSILTTNQKQLITSIAFGGAFIGAATAGLTTDRCGRKLPIYAGCLIYVAGAVLQASSYSLAQFAVGRLVLGIGMGGVAMVLPLYVSELTPSKYRGKVVGLYNIIISGSQVASYGIGIGLASISNGWRVMAALGAAPAIAIGLLLLSIPESPKHLIDYGKLDEAATVIQRIFPNATTHQIEEKVKLTALGVGVESSQRRKWDNGNRSLFKQLYAPRNFKATLTACGLMVVAQLSGYPSLLYYSPTLLSVSGFSDSLILATVIPASHCFSTLLYFTTIGRCKPRRVLLATMWATVAFLIATAVAIKMDSLNDYSDLSAPDLESANEVSGKAALALIFIVFFIGFSASGAGNIALLSSTFFPTEIRIYGATLLACSGWIANTIVASSFLTQVENTTGTAAFGLYAAVWLVGWVAVYFCYPDIKGLAPEEVREVFNHRFGVSYARKLQKDTMRARSGQKGEA